MPCGVKRVPPPKVLWKAFAVVGKSVEPVVPSTINSFALFTIRLCGRSSPLPPRNVLQINVVPVVSHLLNAMSVPGFWLPSPPFQVTSYAPMVVG